ncbi:conserved Plasmodium protein, unknown function [Plasmodium knowlesi strain H]|uniref:CS domain-containing protein n=3 Tax=Plasmodium knowlesi TaxID=5850 RepID=A0A5K1VFX2_PLAKH|nr:conserved Plasmodium protein, unknown function [Plasmodium knowlesi strain H]OTN65335.1 Uncharacterized protein PKNOH_S110114000 [Plasmodium knowlesi]CAA9989758.1 conserved Plasmodium protein, unknown function [Plasmodium knowlesi strain H]SBO22924.1 conserved Plasmodium protein, unknown function [Plasmodium knowlesi strain H]SBO22977.1 conserved Plasmodium protein, unknown function [Plasmodium knowlesi strain H]VVS79232.1 conserved Plasmodium protein, unknown function [Plasmodium knowlesi |eukprot:XP_002260481.1 hypothetical protein, conserved in Plasmodium species [Plasmodium knowlesi strain H]
MELTWRENFDSVEIRLKKEISGEGGDSNKSVFSDVRCIEDLSSYDEYVVEVEKAKDLLISDTYIRINQKNKTMNIDLYDKISMDKDHVHVRENTHFIILNLKKKERKLWGHLCYFNIFVIYRNAMYPNLIKCTKEEKKILIAQEKKFKSVINDRRIKSLDDLKKMLRRNRNSRDDFMKKLQDDAQRIQSQMEEQKNELLRNQKEEIRKRAVDSIYEDCDESEMNKLDEHHEIDMGNRSHENVDNRSELHISGEKKSNDINSQVEGLVPNDIGSKHQLVASGSDIVKKDEPKVLLLQDRETQNKVIELKFTQMKRNELPARESRMLNKKLPTCTSTKNFFLIVLIEKAKKLYLKNSDFVSCLETLKSVLSYLVVGHELSKEEHIKVLNNFSLLHLLTNNLEECILACDRCLVVINEEVKSYNVEDFVFEENALKDGNNSHMKTWNTLEKIKSKNCVQYLYSIYTIVSARKVLALIKQGEENHLENVEKIYLSIEDIKKYLPCHIFENFQKGITNLRLFTTLMKQVRNINLECISHTDQVKQGLALMNKHMVGKYFRHDISFCFCFTMIRSYNLKNLNRYYENVVNIVLCIFVLIEKEQENYFHLNNVERCAASTFTILHVYQFLLLIKNESSFCDKVGEMDNFDVDAFQCPQIRDEIMHTLTNHMVGEYTDLDFILQNNLFLKGIVSPIYRDGDDILQEEALQKRCENNQKEEELLIEEHTTDTCQTKEQLFPLRDNLLQNIPYKMKKSGKIVKHFCRANTHTYHVRIETFGSVTEYLNVKQKCELLKIEIVTKMIKSMCYTLNIIQKMHKENEKKKTQMKKVIYTLLADLSWSIHNINPSCGETENVISLLFLYFCFSFIYNYPKNEFIIDTHYKRVNEEAPSNYLSLNDAANEGAKFSKDKLKSILEKTFLYKFFLDYKKYIDLEKKKKKNQSSVEFTSQYDPEHNAMLQKITFLIKKIKKESKGKTKINSYYPIITLINNKYMQELQQFASFLEKKYFYLESMRCRILLLTSHYYSPSLSNFSLPYIFAFRTIFASSFFETNEQRKVTPNNSLTIASKKKLQKSVSHFTDAASLTFKNAKRTHFLQSLKDGDVQKALVPYIRTVLCRLKRVKIVRTISTSLHRIHADGDIQANIREVLLIYLDNLSVDFYILNRVFHFSLQEHISPPLLLNEKATKNTIKFSDISCCAKSTKLLSNIEEYKHVLNHYYKKFLRTKILLLSGQCTLCL